MTNKTITLSRELALDLRAVVASHNTSKWSSAVLERIDAALAEPVPPAGGEPEVLPSPMPEVYAWGHDMGGNYAEGKADGFNECLDACTPIVTRLQAEVERLKDSLDDACQMIIQNGRRANDLQSELTKAREDLAQINRLIYATGAPLGGEVYFSIRELAAPYHQSAPAAKDGA